MAYNNYYPATYQPMYPQAVQAHPAYQQQAQPTQPVPQGSNSITWVQGEAGAKAYPLAPASNALLMDSEKDVFYIKSSDASGMPLPLRVFEYKEIIPNNEVIDMKHSHDESAIDTTKFATKDDLQEIRRMLEEMKRKGERNNGKQSV